MRKTATPGQVRAFEEEELERWFEWRRWYYFFEGFFAVLERWFEWRRWYYFFEGFFAAIGLLVVLVWVFWSHVNMRCVETFL